MTPPFFLTSTTLEYALYPQSSTLAANKKKR